MKIKTCIVLLLAFLASLAAAQTTAAPTAATSIETVTTFDFSHKNWIKNGIVSEVVTQRIVLLHNIFGLKGTYLDARGFGGFDLTQHTIPAGGLTLIGNVMIAKEASIGIGPVGLIAQGKPISWGIYIGLHVTLSK